MPAIQLFSPPVQIYADGARLANAQPITLATGSGSNGLTTFEFVVEPTGRSNAGGRAALEGIEIMNFDQAEIELVISGDAVDRVVYCGNVLASHNTLDADNGDSIRLLARVEDLHFGVPLSKAPYWDSHTGRVIGLDIPWVFNPEYDGQVWPNLSQKQHPVLKCGLFIHPESLQSDAAKEFAASPRTDFWTLWEAVQTVCEILNPSTLSGGRKIQNPIPADLVDVLGFDTGLLRNHQLPFGEYLPEVLDNLLEPFGFSWCVDTLARGSGSRRIRVYSRNVGTPTKAITLQSSGSTINVKQSNTESLSLTADVSSGLFNSLTIFGDYETYESTFELIAGWPTQYDLLDQDLLTKEGGPDAAWRTHPNYYPVWRNWVLNEAGDYNGMRDGVSEPYNFDYLFGVGRYVAHRRRFLPCLSRNDDGSPRGQAVGVYVQYSTDEGSTWQPVDTLSGDENSVQVLHRECGIRFNGENVPFELWNAGNHARVRVTACVQSDTRIVYQPPFFTTPLNAFKRQYIFAPSKFKYQIRDQYSIFEDVENNLFFDPGAWPKDKIERNDTPAIQDMTQRLIQRYCVGLISGSVSITGIDNPALRIGDTVSGLAGRGLGFKTHPAGLYPSIIGFKFNFENQSTDVVLGTYRGGQLVS
jgi:hypothetical protein